MFKTFTLVALGAVALAGCGGGPPSVEAADGSVKVTLDEYRITPERVRVRAGAIRLTARNVGRLTHNLVVQERDTPTGKEPKVYGRTDTAHPGETVTGRRVFVLRPGTYRLVCTIGNHDDLGQYGELKVIGR